MLVAPIFLVATGFAQDNIWTNLASGSWHEPTWSLGVLPAIDQRGIIFTNSGSKALTIDSTTARDHPATLSISNLLVGSFGDSFNSLLLSYAGLQSPLQVEDKLSLGSNSMLITLASSLRVKNQLLVDGTVIHSGRSEVTAGTLGLGVNARAVYNLDNSSLTASNIVIGFWRPWEPSAPPATFNHDGGYTRVGGVEIHRGEYALQQGELAAGGILVGAAGFGYFRQLSGRVVVSNFLSIGAGDARTSRRGTGNYVLSGGSLNAGMVQVGSAVGSSSYPGGNGAFEQSGGTNFAGELHVGPFQSYSQANFSYTLNNGLLQTSNSVVNGYANFVQSGGMHSIDGPLVVQGYGARYYSAASASYQLNKGIIRSRSVTVKTASFSQSWDTTNQIDGDLLVGEDLFVGGTSYRLSGGNLVTSNTVVAGSYRNTIVHNGGEHVVSGTLDLQQPIIYYSGTISDGIRYDFQLGYLAIHDIRVSTNSVFRHTGGRIYQTGTLTLAGGTWHSEWGDHQLGALKLEASSTNSSLSLTTSSNVLRFASSAAAAWDPTAKLVIRNWRGALDGSGHHQVIFGDNSGGLTSAQLNQIRFLDPAGLPTGAYAAAILGIGEIVPLRPTGPDRSITLQRTSALLRMEWPSGYTLQTATNIAGPFVDLDTDSPYTVDPRAGPQRYFRFRQ